MVLEADVFARHRLHSPHVQPHGGVFEEHGAMAMEGAVPMSNTSTSHSRTAVGPDITRVTTKTDEHYEFERSSKKKV